MQNHINELPKEPKPADCKFCYRKWEFECIECHNKFCGEPILEDKICTICNDRKNGNGEVNKFMLRPQNEFIEQEKARTTSNEGVKSTIPTKEEFIKNIKERAFIKNNF